MAFLENLGKKIGETAQAAAKKSSELVETTKLNASINAEEEKIHRLYSQMGKTAYQHFSETGTTEEYLREACEQIVAHEQNIKELREKIAEVKGIKSCVGCGAEMERSQVFCSKCGAKNEIQQAAPEEAAAPSAACPSCGVALAPGSAFCTSCGTKL
ncbi:MAG: zinc-ribbon domain-containing protein [Clostridiaceae bacterium]|jgi:predicted nucleic acid-binding Zn ribbon protein|nr:zinc-ribbon domain-containing protein [Clostridiaceae bacterium]